MTYKRLYPNERVRRRAISKKRQPVWGASNFNYIYARCKSSALGRGLVWDISKDEFRTISSQNCFYCGRPPLNKTKRHNRPTIRGYYRWNGLDRIDNGIGYRWANVVPCCAICNRMRMGMSQDEFLAQVHTIARNTELFPREPSIYLGQPSAR